MRYYVGLDVSLKETSEAFMTLHRKVLSIVRDDVEDLPADRHRHLRQGGLRQAV
jgi:hypothetical protein